jgi:hypothetical protein
MNVDARENVMKFWGKVPEVLSGNYKIKLTCTFIFNIFSK